MNLNFQELRRKFENLAIKQQDRTISPEYEDQRKQSNNLESQKNQSFNQNHRQSRSKFDNAKIEEFFLFSTLGTGTFGRVRQAKWKREPNGEVYALKMLKKTEIVRLNQVEHIKSEKSILQRTKFPFIVAMRGCFQDEKYVYMLFEYVSGGELFSRLRKDGRFSNDVALFYACEIMLSIQYLHKMNIVYRDLKPENLLIDKEGHIKITDFGFAKQLSYDRTYTLCGTPEYLAPEIIKGSKVGYGKSVDWWALGILIFEMLSGYPPFYDNEPIGIYKKIVAGIIEFPRFFDVKAKDLIRKLLNPDINFRLGCEDSGESIKYHKWFRGVDWEAVYNREIPAPWTPYLKNEEDSSWFEKYPDSKDPPKTLPKELQHLFENF